MKRILSLAIILLVLPTLSRAADNDFFFKKGDRIVFLGDSITEQCQYSTDIELYLTTRFPQWNLTFINAGIGGDTATGGAGRFQKHVLDEKPTAVTINFGMNDAGYQKFNPQANENFKKQTTAMLEMAKKAGVRVALLAPNAVDRRVSPAFSDFKVYLETQKQFYAPLKDIAAEHGAVFVDQYAKTRAALEKMEADDPKAQKVKPFGDGFHTAPPGGLFMAHAILTGLNASALVSDVEINAATGTSTPKACKIADLKATANGVAFTRSDDALPMPVAPEWASLLPYVNDLKDLNYYGLKVKGLAAAKYTLLIDGKDVANYSADQLAEGVNLGSLTTGPIYQQGKEVFDAINAKNNIVNQRFRGVVMFQAPDWLADVAAERKPKELAKRMQQIEEQQAEIYKKVQPVARRFELKQTP
jgi:lysophospholipase L1-like esterase